MVPAKHPWIWEAADGHIKLPKQFWLRMQLRDDLAAKCQPKRGEVKLKLYLLLPLMTLTLSFRRRVGWVLHLVRPDASEYDNTDTFLQKS